MPGPAEDRSYRTWLAEMWSRNPRMAPPCGSGKTSPFRATEAMAAENPWNRVVCETQPEPPALPVLHPLDPKLQDSSERDCALLPGFTCLPSVRSKRAAGRILQAWGFRLLIRLPPFAESRSQTTAPASGPSCTSRPLGGNQNEAAGLPINKVKQFLRTSHLISKPGLRQPFRGWQ